MTIRQLIGFGPLQAPCWLDLQVQLKRSLFDRRAALLTFRTLLGCRALGCRKHGPPPSGPLPEKHRLSSAIACIAKNHDRVHRAAISRYSFRALCGHQWSSAFQNIGVGQFQWGGLERKKYGHNSKSCGHTMVLWFRRRKADPFTFTQNGSATYRRCLLPS